MDSIEYEVSFEKIDNKLKIQTSVNNGWIITAFFLIVMGLLFLTSSNEEVTLVLLFFAITFIIIGFLTKRKSVSIETYDGNNIELYFTRNNKTEVIEFANQIITSGNSYLLQKYSKLDKDLPIENQLNNLDYLRNKEIISEEQFENLKNQLLGRENKSSIGFIK